MVVMEVGAQQRHKQNGTQRVAKTDQAVVVPSISPISFLSSSDGGYNQSSPKMHPFDDDDDDSNELAHDQDEEWPMVSGKSSSDDQLNKEIDYIESFFIPGITGRARCLMNANNCVSVRPVPTIILTETRHSWIEDKKEAESKKTDHDKKKKTQERESPSKRKKKNKRGSKTFTNSQERGPCCEEQQQQQQRQRDTPKNKGNKKRTPEEKNRDHNEAAWTKMEDDDSFDCYDLLFEDTAIPETNHPNRRRRQSKQQNKKKNNTITLMPLSPQSRWSPASCETFNDDTLAVTEDVSMKTATDLYTACCNKITMRRASSTSPTLSTLSASAGSPIPLEANNLDGCFTKTYEINEKGEVEARHYSPVQPPRNVSNMSRPTSAPPIIQHPERRDPPTSSSPSFFWKEQSSKSTSFLPFDETLGRDGSGDNGASFGHSGHARRVPRSKNLSPRRSSNARDKVLPFVQGTSLSLGPSKNGLVIMNHEGKNNKKDKRTDDSSSSPWRSLSTVGHSILANLDSEALVAYQPPPMQEEGNMRTKPFSYGLGIHDTKLKR